MIVKNSASIHTLYLFSVIHSVIPLASPNNIKRLVFVMVTHGFSCCASAVETSSTLCNGYFFGGGGVIFVVLMLFRSIFARNLVVSLFVGFMSGRGWALLENVT